MATVPRLPRYCQRATTPDPASLGLIDSPSGTARARRGSFSLARSLHRAGPNAGPGLDCCSWQSPFQLGRVRTRPGLPGSPAVRLQLCSVPATPDGPSRLASGGASGAAPALTRTKAPTLQISRLNSAASLTPVYASRRALLRAMQYSVPAGWLAFAGWECLPTGLRCKVSVSSGAPPFLYFLLARASPGARSKLDAIHGSELNWT